MSLVEITGDQLGEEVLQAPKAVLDFWAPTCHPCKGMEPVVRRLAESYGDDLIVARVNADASPQLARQFGVRGLPAMIVLKKGQPVKKILGVHGLRELQAAIDAC